MEIKILIADDHGITRDGLRALLEKEENITVIGEAKNGREAVQIAMEYQPDIIVMDINMPELNGMEATRQILSQTTQTKIIVLSMFSERRYVSSMLKLGVSGYLLKSSAFEELVKAIHAVMNNQGYLSQKITNVVMKDYSKTLSSSKASVFDALTSREIEVFQLIAEGHRSKSIAEKLHISVKTVSTHRYQLLKKLQINSVAELTKLAIQEGIITLD